MSLLNKLIQAATDLYPAGTVYFKEYQPGNDGEILRNIAEAINKMPTTQDQININSGLQQRTAKYASDLQKSKGGSRSRQDN